MPPTLSLTADKLDSAGVYLLDNAEVLRERVCGDLHTPRTQDTLSKTTPAPDYELHCGEHPWRLARLHSRVRILVVAHQLLRRLPHPPRAVRRRLANLALPPARRRRDLLDAERL